MVTSEKAGWYVDPADATRYRFWGGGQWTTHVRNRGEVDIAAAEAELDAASRPLPDFDAPEGEDPGPLTGRRHRRLPVLLAVIALAVIGGAAGVVTLRSSESGLTLSGEIRVAPAALRSGPGRTDAFVPDGGRCGTGTNPGIGAGTEVTVSNARGQVLGQTELPAGHLDRTLTSTACVFRYEVDGVDDAAVYVVQVEGRAPTRMTRDEVVANDGRIDLRFR